jgi:heterodisulfide reductase subunit A-like polyferredoxin
LRIKQEGINKLTIEITSLRSGEQDTFSSIQEKDNAIMKITSDLNIARNKYRELEEEMEERE